MRSCRLLLAPVWARVACVVLLLPAWSHASQVVPQSADELAAAPRIVVADLLGQQSRWNLQGNLIVTDQRFRTVEALRGSFGAEFVLTQGGGTVGMESHALSEMPALRSGSRYLLLLNENDNPVFSSVRYGPAGAIEIDRGSGALASRILDGARLDDFRALVGRTPVVDDLALLPPVLREQTLPAKVYRRDASFAVGPTTAPLAADGSTAPADASVASSASVGALAPDILTAIVPHYSVQRRPAPFVVFNPLPLAWVWHPADQNMMAEWNRYGDVFRVLSTPTGDWAWTNNRYDLAGFPDNATMIAQFGAGWGATTLAICYTRWFGDGPIVEADIAINPAYGWTLDDEFGTRDGSSPWSFRQTIQHELGHSWGLKHPFESSNVFWPSTMNYGPKWARTPTVHSDDTAAIRWAYPGIAIHDGSLVMYRTSDGGGNDAAYTASTPLASIVTHGGALAFSGAVTLQNLGTTNLVDPAVDFYLTERRMDFAGAVYLGRANYTTTVAPFPSSIALLNLGTQPVTSSVPTGVYFPALYLAASGATDQALGNNAAWVNDTDTVTIRNQVQALVPTTVDQLAPLGRIGPNGTWRFSFVAAANATYEFSTCGNAAFDTVIELSGVGGPASSDDDCALQSRLRWSSPIAQTVSLSVRGFSQAAQGEFRLVYRVEPDLLFAHGFDN